MSGNPFLNRLNNKSAHGGKSEKRIAKKTTGRLTPGSGAMSGAKSDIVLSAFRVECKSTVKQSLSLKKGWLDKITHEALSTNRVPALSISFVTSSGNAVAEGDWVMIPLHIFNELVGVP